VAELDIALALALEVMEEGHAITAARTLSSFSGSSA
jgi:hypothetical protein